MAEKINMIKKYRDLLDRCGACGRGIKVYKLLGRGERKILVKCKSEECGNHMLWDRPSLVDVMVQWNKAQRNAR